MDGIPGPLSLLVGATAVGAGLHLGKWGATKVTNLADHALERPEKKAIEAIRKAVKADAAAAKRR